MGASEREPWSSLKLWIVLSRTFDAIREHAARSAARHDLSLSEFGVLEALYHNGPLQLCDLRDEILVSSGGITYLADELEERGLVERRPHPTDQRARMVALTPAGDELIDRIFPEHARAVAEATSGLDQREKRRAIRLLRKLGTAATKLGEVTAAAGGD